MLAPSEFSTIMPWLITHMVALSDKLSLTVSLSILIWVMAQHWLIHSSSALTLIKTLAVPLLTLSTALVSYCKYITNLVFVPKCVFIRPNGTIVLLDNEVTTTSTSVCARVLNGTYFAIARQDGDWQSAQPYDELQATLKWVGLALYFVVVIFGVFQLAFVATNFRSLIRGQQKIVFVTIVLVFNIREYSIAYWHLYTNIKQFEVSTLHCQSTRSKSSTLCSTCCSSYPRSCSSQFTPSFFTSGTLS